PQLDGQTQEPAAAGKSADPANPAAETQDEREKRPNNVPAKERIKQLTDKVKSKDAEIASLTAQLEQLQAQGWAGDPMDYASDAEYIRAVAAQTANEVAARALADQRNRAIEEARQARVDAWQERCEAMRSVAPDFDQVITNPSLPIPPHVAQAMQAAENGPSVAYYLGKNPQEAARIARLAPLDAAIAIGSLSQRLNVPANRKTTQAPPPVKTVTGAGNVHSPDPAKMSHADYRAWRKRAKA
ncbi:MAG TPA: hypothetical protein VNJ05_01045, partial [Sphingomicrobium sp.]|nr:hypothetical protein [Sphingomicrobium sp.]